MPAVLLACATPLLFAESTDDNAVVAVVQKLFDGIAAHDARVILAAMLPDAHISSVRDQAAPVVLNAAELSTRIGASKGVLLERFTAEPKVLIRGRIAQLWSPYEFLRDGKRTHCGIDTVTLLKSEEGWKIASLSYTVETSGCQTAN